MERRALLVVFVALAVAGCLGAVGGDGGESTATGTATSGATAETTASSGGTPAPGTATPTPLPDTVVPFPAGPKSRPERPDRLTAETAAAFVKRHEFRYSYNRLWSGPGSEVGMSAEHSCTVEDTDVRAGGYVVTVRCTGYLNEPVAGNSTRTRHADYPPWTVRYYVDEDSLLREEVDG